jgi:metabolite-proton symporter
MAEDSGLGRLTGEHIEERTPMRRVAASVLIGTTIEWYDFLVYSTAAGLVFGQLFFPTFDPVAGTLAAFSTFAVGFFARPFGGMIFGHFGDRVGRKGMLVLSLTLMGVATFLVGLLPSYESIGISAPIILVLLRLIQGFGVGGEWGGAVLAAVEYSSPGRRGLYGSLPQIGVPAGLILSTLAFLLVARLPEEQFLAWGWRLPFLVSIVLVAIGLYIRLKIMETPAFRQMREEGAEARMPLVEVIRNNPRRVALATASIISTGTFFYVANSFAINYATDSVGMDRAGILLAIVVGNAVGLVAMPLFGAFSDRVGRKSLVLVGLAGMGLWIFPLFWLIDTGVLLWVVLGYVVGILLMSISYGPQATFISELFATRVRFSGASTSFQLGVMLGGAPAPIISSALVAATGASLSVSLYVAAMSLISIIGVILVTQTDLAEGGMAAQPDVTDGDVPVSG